MKELRIEAKPDNLDNVLDFICTELRSNGCDEETLTAICISAEEIFVNIAHYAYNPTIGGAAIRVSSDSEVHIEFEDSGKPYNPLEKPDPDISLEADSRDIGGLGIFMVKNLMDSVSYEHKDNKNILTIKKAL